MPNLIGIHDHEGLAITPPDTWVLNLAALSENPRPPEFVQSVHWITRLNWGYGSTGTLPVPDQYGLYTARAKEYVRQSQNCHRWIVGNEPNLSREWPDRQPIFPYQYAACYKITRQAIRSLPGHEQDEVLVAASGPWNAELKYPGNPSGDWINYFVDVLAILGADVDGFSLHAYTHGYAVHLVTSSARMDAPFQAHHFEFLTYRDYLEAVPENLWHLPSYITEANGNGPWQAVGLMPAMAQEVNWWNSVSQQKIGALIFYRYPTHDEFAIEGKPDVIAEYKATVARGFQSPVGARPKGNVVRLPDVRNEDLAPAPEPPSPAPSRELSPAFKQRVPNFTPAQANPGQKFYKLIRADYLPPPEGARTYGPDHHILVDVVDAQGKRIMRAPVNFYWADGVDIVPVNKEREPYGADFPMNRHGQSFGVWVGNFRQNSDDVFGMGLGTIEQPDWNHHVTYFLVFQEQIAQQQTQPAPEPVQPPPREPAQPPPTRNSVPRLTHPVRDIPSPRISQRFAETAEDYARFGIKGHTGIDFAVPMRTAVVAVDDGVVLERGNDPDGYGLYYKLKHAWGESLYAHLSEQDDYGPGHSIGRGTFLGYSGNTGNSTGPHLHFAIRLNGYRRGWPYDGFSDPQPYLTGAARVEDGNLDDWNRTWPVILSVEGELSTDRNDPGNYRPDGTFVGTKWGISANAYPQEDIVNLTKERALQLHYRDRWVGSGADKLPWPLNALHADAYVQNPAAARNFLRDCGGDPHLYMALRIEWYTDIRQFELYGRGWMRRCAQMLRLMAS